MSIFNEDMILSGEDISFLDIADSEETPQDNNEENNEEKDNPTEDLDPESLFENPEEVSSEENNKEERSTSSTEESSSPDNSDFYYQLANALVEEGTLSNLDKDFVNTIKSPEDFTEAIEREVNSRLDEKQRRINNALEADVEPAIVKQYENILGYLDSIQESAITDESEKGETLRKNLIYQDFINRGYSKERATREVKKSFDSGSDIEDAKDALLSNKDFYGNAYDKVIKEAQEEAKAERAKTEKEAKELRKSLLEDKEVFEGISIDKTVRQKAYEAITKPVYKTEDGEYLTAIQKYEEDNPVEFRKKLGILYTMTDGFKNLDKLIRGKVNKEVKSHLRELEHTLKTSDRPRGNLSFIGGSKDSESYFGKGWQLDLS